MAERRLLWPDSLLELVHNVTLCSYCPNFNSVTINLLILFPFPLIRSFLNLFIRPSTVCVIIPQKSIVVGWDMTAKTQVKDIRLGWVPLDLSTFPHSLNQCMKNNNDQPMDHVNQLKSLVIHSFSHFRLQFCWMRIMWSDCFTVQLQTCVHC